MGSSRTTQVGGYREARAMPMLALLPFRLVRDKRTTALGQSHMGGARVVRCRDIALFLAAFRTIPCTFDLACSIAAQVLRLPDKRGVIFNFQVGKTLRRSSHAVVATRDSQCNELCAVQATGVSSSLRSQRATGGGCYRLFAGKIAMACSKNDCGFAISYMLEGCLGDDGAQHTT